MNNANFMIEVTARDFDVEQIATQGEFTLYGALRKDHWHMVLLQCPGNGVNRVEQLHIPRYEMAEELGTLLRMGDLHPNSRPLQYRSLILLEGGGIGFQGFGDWSPQNAPALNEDFANQLRGDLPLLDESRAKVQEREGTYFLPKALTAAGHPVESFSERLLQAIDFEHLTTKKLDAGKFGIYSAYCTYRDFDLSIEMPEETITEIIKGQFEYTVDDVDEETLDLFMKVQEKALSQPIWGRGITMELSQAVRILSEGMASLTRTQRVQFILMNGMHSAGLFLALAAVTGVISFSHYAYLITSGLQPDSPEEQDLRKETAYIQLYGELA